MLMATAIESIARTDAISQHVSILLLEENDDGAAAF